MCTHHNCFPEIISSPHAETVTAITGDTILISQRGGVILESKTFISGSDDCFSHLPDMHCFGRNRPHHRKFSNNALLGLGPQRNGGWGMIMITISTMETAATAAAEPLWSGLATSPGLKAPHAMVRGLSPAMGLDSYVSIQPLGSGASLCVNIGNPLTPSFLSFISSQYSTNSQGAGKTRENTEKENTGILATASTQFCSFY